MTRVGGLRAPRDGSARLPEKLRRHLTVKNYTGQTLYLNSARMRAAIQQTSLDFTRVRSMHVSRYTSRTISRTARFTFTRNVYITRTCTI